jgi:peptidoglycan/LPS O-acetylase OafA/YrhL|tara:strand:+ start:191 stop:307 length:117 start_codon:yes stop_codon:yes gene_type:complete
MECLNDAQFSILLIVAGLSTFILASISYKYIEKIGAKK